MSLHQDSATAARSSAPTRSALRDLRNLFDRRIGAREIAVPLVSFDEDADVQSVVGFMQSRFEGIAAAERFLDAAERFETEFHEH